MIGLLVTGHGRLPKAMLDVVKQTAGEFEKLDFLSTEDLCSGEELEKKMLQKIKELNDGDGILIMTDMIGSSCMNVACLLSKKIKEIKIEIVTGVNIAMILKACFYRTKIKNIKELAKIVSQAGKNSIVVASEELL